MNRVAWIAVALGSGLLGGAAGGLAAVWWQSAHPAKPPVAVAAPELDELGDWDEMDRRISALEQSVVRLQREGHLMALAGAPAPEAGQPRSVPSARSVDDPVFEEAVRDVVQRVQTERNAERESRRTERRRAAAQRWSEQLADRLSLRDEQKTKLATLAVEFAQEMHNLWRPDGGAEPPSREARREQMTKLRSQYEQRMGEVLNRDQLETYQGLDEQERLGFGFGRRRPPPGQ